MEVVFCQSTALIISNPLIAPFVLNKANEQQGYVDRTSNRSLLYLPIPNIGITHQYNNGNSIMASIGNTYSLRKETATLKLDTTFFNQNIYDGFNINIGLFKNETWAYFKSNHGLYVENYITLPQTFKYYTISRNSLGFKESTDTFYLKRALQMNTLICFANNIEVKLNQRIAVIFQLNVGVNIQKYLQKKITYKIVSLNALNNEITETNTVYETTKQTFIDYITAPTITLKYKL
jgi:hypothetical protein